MKLERMCRTLIFTLLCVVGVNAQGSMKPDIKVEYDKFRDGTFLSFEPVNVSEDKSITLRLGMLTGFKGQTPKKPNDLLLVFVSPSIVESNAHKSNRGLIILADGKRYPMGDASYEAKYSMPLYLEVMSVKVPYDTFLELSNAKKIEMQFGSTEFELQVSMMEAVRYFASRVKVQP